MQLTKIQCQTCGGEINPTNDKYYKCEYCGMVYEVKESISDTLIHSLRNAALRKKQCKFDEAVKEYEDIIEENPECIEAFWGALLADCGIAYSNKNNEASPIFYKINKNRITANHFYTNLTNLASNEEKRSYSNRIAEIDTLRTQININLDNYRPDLVVCTIEDLASKDYQVGVQLTNSLKNKGYKVFNTVLELAKTPYRDYEAKLFPALYNAKGLIVISSSVENSHLDYVKSCWKRFNDMEHQSEQRKLFFMAIDSREESYPFELRRSQIINENNAIKSIEEFIPLKVKKPVENVEKPKEETPRVTEAKKEAPRKDVPKASSQSYKQEVRPERDMPSPRQEARGPEASFNVRGNSYDRIDTNPQALIQIAQKVKSYNLAQLNVLRTCLGDLSGLSYEWDDSNLYQILAEMNRIIHTYEGLIPEASSFSDWLEEKANLLIQNQK